MLSRSTRLVVITGLVTWLLGGRAAAGPVTQEQKRKPPRPVSAPLRNTLNLGTIESRLDHRIPELLKQGMVPGLAIAIIRNGKVAWHKGYGTVNSVTREPVTDETVFEAASLAKPLFAYGVLKLVDAGLLDLDKPLMTYLPGTYDVGNDPRLAQVTARRALSHTTGFPNWRPRGDPTLKIYFTPGERFSYSGEGFVYLARVVERVTKEDLETVMQRLVLRPLGMTSSSYVWRDDFVLRKGYNHNAIGEPTGQTRPERANPAWSLHTTPSDYARFIAAVLSGTGLKQDTLKQMLTAQVRLGDGGPINVDKAPASLTPDLSWGLGWGLQQSKKGEMFWHWGDNGSSKAWTAGFVRQKMGVVIFANGANGLAIIPDILALAVGGTYSQFVWFDADRYNTPRRTLLRAVVTGGAPTALARYKRHQPKQPARQNVDEAGMNRIGYDLLNSSRVDDAVAVFEFNVARFPGSSNTYDGLAQAYEAAGQIDLAIHSYERALKLDPGNKDAAERLKKLRGA
jgi:CubicO group peptidase (beta-lactamase class C family)